MARERLTRTLVSAQSDEEKADAAEERAEADEEKAQAERHESEADRDDAASKESSMTTHRRQRLTWTKAAARAPGGLYGFTKRIQADCEVAIRRLNKRATSLARSAYSKDERVPSFLQTHAKRAKSNSAKVILAAMKTLGPKLGSGGKVAASKTPGLYGYPSNTVKLGLAICASLREDAGLISAALHARRANKHAGITGFLSQHARKARCQTSRMLSACYPDADAAYVKVASPVDMWLAWDESELDDEPEHFA